MSKFESFKLTVPYLNHIQQSRSNCYLCRIFRKFLRIYLAEHFVRKKCDSTYCNFLNIKFRHRYFFANITKFSEQVSLKHLQEHILLMSKSEHMLKLTSHRILPHLWSADLLKSFSQLIMSIFCLFSIFLLKDFEINKQIGKVWGYPTLLIS